jgi:hypothetical protein
MLTKREQYNLVAAAIDECESYELTYVSPALERLYQNKYYFRNADDLYRTMGRHGFKRVSDIQEVINKVKERRG